MIYLPKLKVYNSIALLTITAFAITVLHCVDDPKEETPRVFLQPIKAPIGVSFINLYPDTFNIQNVKVILIDPGGKVVSSNGVPFDTLDVQGGVLSIGLLSEAKFSPTAPYRFYVKVESDGYETNIRPIVITRDVPNFVPISMVKIRNETPLNGLVLRDGQVKGVNQGVLQSIPELYFAPPAGLSDPLTISSSPEKSLILYSNGNRINESGNLGYQLVWANPLDTLANRVFPGGYKITDAIDTKGNKIATPDTVLFFDIANWFSLKMAVNGIKVDSFSEPVMIELPINERIINSRTQKPVRAGETMSVWSLNEKTGQWLREGAVKLERAKSNPDVKLVAKFEIRHLSVWVVGNSTPSCPSPIKVNYAFDPNNTTGFSGSFFTRFVNLANGADLSASQYITYDNTAELVLEQVPQGYSSQLLVCTVAGNGTFGHIGRSNPLTCSSAQNNITRVTASGTSCHKIQFVSKGVASKFCNNALWHKTSCTSTSGLYTFCGIINSAGQIDIPNLTGSKCLRLWYLDAAAPSTPLTMDFTLDLGSPQHPTRQYDGTLRRSSSTTTSSIFPYSVAPSSPCPNILTLTIPEAIFDGNSCN